MRTFIAAPVFAVALALAGPAALAQTATGSASASGLAGTPPSPTAATTSPRQGTAPSSPTITGTSSGDAFTGASRSPTAGQTSGPSISGTSSGDAFSGPSRGLAPSPQSGRNRAATEGEVATVDDTGAAAGTGGIPGVLGSLLPEATPGMSAGATTAGGARLAAAPANPNVTALASAAVPAGEVLATPLLDRAVREEARRQRASRGGQRMHTQPPNTDVDRTFQVPDDPLSPAIATPDRPMITY